jgi:hypothetical protein
VDECPKGDMEMFDGGIVGHGVELISGEILILDEGRVGHGLAGIESVCS